MTDADLLRRILGAMRPDIPMDWHDQAWLAAKGLATLEAIEQEAEVRGRRIQRAADNPDQWAPVPTDLAATPAPSGPPPLPPANESLMGEPS